MAKGNVDMLVITETVELLQAFLDAGVGEWSIERRANGMRLHRTTLTEALDRHPLHVALGTVEALSYDDAEQTVQSLNHQFRPQLTLFAGRALGSAAKFKAGDLFLVQRVDSGEGFTFESGVLLQEVRYFEMSKGWKAATVNRQGSVPAIRWGESLHLPAVSAKATERGLIDSNGQIAPLGLTDLAHVALKSDTPRLLVLGVERVVSGSGVVHVYQDNPAVIHHLAAFVFAFLPRQIRSEMFASLPPRRGLPTRLWTRK